MTFSLVACDLERQEWGVAVASKFLAVGAVVPWVRSGVGAVATQSYANVLFGPDGLELMAGGAGAAGALDRLVSADDQAQERQVGLVDAGGGSATFTGSSCHDWAGGRHGPGYAAQGNILAGPQVVDALVETFTATEGPLAERLLAALAAGDNAGGDRRGRQSAALSVRRPGGGYGGNNDILIDLRVDDHADPVPELARLYQIHDRLFGVTPADRLIPLEQVSAELADRLGRLGHDGDPAAALADWASTENLEERLYDGVVDPVVLDVLREQS
jgi:uncharacterized Ntn-hydrolase superfamily protein